MREIKFRAWVNEEDEEYSRMVHSEQSILTILGHKYGGTGIARPAGFSDIDNQPKPERYVLMQYTGLKDKNGREIYEGDILKHAANDDYLPIYDLNGDLTYYKTVEGYAQQGVIDFKNGGFEYKTNKTLAGRHENIHIPLAYVVDKYCEVIGNIYENPELLEVSV